MAATPNTVLLFEDDESQAFVTKEALEKDGFVVDVCQTGREGLARLLNKDYDVYLIDMKLPDIQGIEVLRRLNTIRPGSVSIIVTGHGDEIAAVEAMKLGAYDYIIKLPRMDHLAALPLVIREGLERRHLKSERAQLQTELWEQARLLEERNAELRRANEQLKRADQFKSDLVSTVGHELRTPLATMKAFTTILSDQIAGPVTADQREYLGIIEANVDRLARIIDDLLDMAKIEAGRVVLNKRVVEIGPLLDHVVQSVQPLAHPKRIDLEVQIAKGLPGVFADSDKLTQILVNLVTNAIKFTKGPGRVTMSVSEQANEIEFSVTDTGVGISAEDLPKLFERFKQLESVPGVGNLGGAGLGLAISKRFVEIHGGRIWATSTPGQGSTFSFTLPTYYPEEIFHAYLKTGIEQAQRRRGSFSIVVFSIQGFQEFKTVYGFQETNRFLKELEQTLRGAVRRRDGGDIVVRWRHGEMLAALAHINKAGSQAMAARIKQIIEERPFTIASKSLTVPIVTATATYPDEGMTEQELVNVIESQLQRSDKPKMRIMVVDDEPKIRQFLKEVLEFQEYEVLTVASGPDALEQLKRNRIDLVLLDLAMPVMDGYEVYHLLKEDAQTKEVPVIIVTGKGERKDRQLGLDSVPYNYVEKPFQIEELVAKIREVLPQQQSVKA
jgi:diguanylate cyclase (GGDEF)-like protein